MTYIGRFTHISGHPSAASAAGWVQDRETSPVEDWRSTTVLCNQLKLLLNWIEVGGIRRHHQ